MSEDHLNRGEEDIRLLLQIVEEEIPLVDLEEKVMHSIQENQRSFASVEKYKRWGKISLVVNLFLLLLLGFFYYRSALVSNDLFTFDSGVLYWNILFLIALLVLFIQVELIYSLTRRN